MLTRSRMQSGEGAGLLLSNRRQVRFRDVLLPTTMPPQLVTRAWTVPAELSWLKAHVKPAEVEKHAQASTLPHYKAKLYADFIVAFPHVIRPGESQEQFLDRQMRLPNVGAFHASSDR